MRKVTTAIVGCGVRTMSLHGPWLKRSERFDLLAVCDVDQTRREFASRQLGVPAVADYQELLGRPDLEAVVVVTTVPWHAPIALEAIRRGKHVLVEKPLADTAEAAHGLADAAERVGVVGMTAYPSRFGPFAAALKRLLAEIEPLQALFTAQRSLFNPQFFTPDHFAGIMDGSSHTLDLALWALGGRPSGVYAQVGRGAVLGDQTIDRVDLLVELDGGARWLNLHTSMLGIEAENLVQVIGRLGLVSSRDQRHLRVVRHPAVTQAGRVVRREVYERRRQQAGDAMGPLTELNIGRPLDITSEELTLDPPRDQQGQMDDHFADLITGAATERLGATLRDGAQVISVTQAMVESAASGRKVSL